jgi:predicted DNA-binding transcriptional regulator YafY
MKNFLLRCQLNNRPVEIMYISNSGEISQRTITIKDIRVHTIQAYCHLKRTYRIFKLDNILSVNYKNIIGSYKIIS